jgi:hypothetical protein
LALIDDSYKAEHADSQKQPSESVSPYLNKRKISRIAEIACPHESEHKLNNRNQGKPSPSASQRVTPGEFVLVGRKVNECEQLGSKYPVHFL